MKETEQKTHQERKEPKLPRKYLYPAAFFALGLMLVIFGFWKTLFVMALTLLGLILGSADNLEDSVKQLLNKLFPPAQKKVTYSQEDLEKLKKALENKESKAAKSAQADEAQENEARE